MKTQLNPCNIQAPLSSKHPVIIQGGMGAAVSHWKLANAVAREGMLGVVSGTGMDHVMARRLQNGDPDGMMRAAIAEFPCPHTAEQALLRYYIPGGKAADKPYKLPPLFRLDSSSDHYAMIALSMFVEVWLAKRGHEGVVGLNLLEKIALPNPALLYGAMLAGVDYVLMGAGIPIQIPGILDQLSRGEAVELRVTVEGDTSTDGVVQRFDPRWVTQENPPALKRPHFIAIVSSAVLAQSLLKRATGSIEGFVVEGHIAGGHNAPPRGPMQLSDRGEPIYGERDGVDLEKFRALGVPFWLAGGQGIPGALASALEQGAAGIQVGTLFAFCTDSGLDPVLRRRALEKAHAGELCIFTDPQASPTGFPFKVVELEGTLSDSTLYAQRQRVCDAGYLRRVCRMPDGTIGYRCPGEPEKAFVEKGGALAETPNRKCLCNALMANVGLAQLRHGEPEQPLLTAGDDLEDLPAILGSLYPDYTAAQAIQLLLQ